MPLPHRFPFRLVERQPDRGVWVVATANMWVLRALDELPFSIGLEMLAQGALELLQADGGDREVMGLLAGIDEAHLLAPVRAGDLLEVHVELVGRFGPLVKAAARLEIDGTPHLTASLLLAQQDPLPA